MRDFPWGATRSFQPLHKICDLDLMFHPHVGDGHLHYTEPLLDTLNPLVFAQRGQPLRDGLGQ